jgi:hypothetical protein
LLWSFVCLVVSNVFALVGLLVRLSLARENPHCGYKRIVGELRGLGIGVSATSVRKVLVAAGLRSAPERQDASWRAFLQARATSVLACDFLTVETAFLQRIYVLFFISLATRRIEYVACSANPDGRWVTRQARNLVMQLGDEQLFRFLVDDRDAKFSRAFDDVLRSEEIRPWPHANPSAERERAPQIRLHRVHSNKATGSRAVSAGDLCLFERSSSSLAVARGVRKLGHAGELVLVDEAAE